MAVLQSGIKMSDSSRFPRKTSQRYVSSFAMLL